MTDGALVYVKNNSIKKVEKLTDTKIICHDTRYDTHNLAKAFDLGSSEECYQIRINGMLSCTFEEVQKLHSNLKGLNFDQKEQCFEILGSKTVNGVPKRLVLTTSEYGYEVRVERMSESALTPINVEDEESEMPQSPPAQSQSTWIREPYSTSFYMTYREGKASFVNGLKKYIDSFKKRKAVNQSGGARKKKPAAQDEKKDGEEENEGGGDEYKTLAHIFYYMKTYSQNDVIITITNWGEQIAEEVGRSKEYLINLIRKKGSNSLKNLFQSLNLDE